MTLHTSVRVSFVHVPVDERAGNLTVVCANQDEALAVRSQLKKIVRPMYSNPPNHGARIVALTLTNPAFLAEW